MQSFYAHKGPEKCKGIRKSKNYLDQILNLIDSLMGQEPNQP